MKYNYFSLIQREQSENQEFKRQFLQLKEMNLQFNRENVLIFSNHLITINFNYYKSNTELYKKEKKFYFV